MLGDVAGASAARRTAEVPNYRLYFAGQSISLARRYRAARPPAATPVVAVPAEGPAR